jgi:hypothetical protein
LKSGAGWPSGSGCRNGRNGQSLPALIASLARTWYRSSYAMVASHRFLRRLKKVLLVQAVAPRRVTARGGRRQAKGAGHGTRLLHPPARGPAPAGVNF